MKMLKNLPIINVLKICLKILHLATVSRWSPVGDLRFLDASRSTLGGGDLRLYSDGDVTYASVDASKVYGKISDFERFPLRWVRVQVSHSPVESESR